MTSQPHPISIPLADEASQERAVRRFLDMFLEDFQKGRQFFHDQLSGFWKAPPRHRLDHYMRHEPVFVVGLELKSWLEDREVSEDLLQALVDYHRPRQPQQPEMPQVDPENPDPEALTQHQAAQEEYFKALDRWEMTMMRLQQGVVDTPDVLQPYWARIYHYRPQLLARLLTDYAKIKKAAEARA